MTATASRTASGTIAGMSTARLARIDEHLRRNYIDSGKIPGALTLVARRGEIAHFSPVGEMDAERGKAMAEDTIFRIYSMSKPITSVALMMLYEEGRFQLDEPVHHFIPEWKDLGVWVGGAYPDFVTRRPDRDMTVRDLLSHQSGLTYGFHMRNSVDSAYRRLKVMDRADDDPAHTLAHSAKLLADLPLVFSPGEQWNYSIATDVCGYLVEVISGQRFDQFVAERIFDPLGMVDSGFHVPDEKLERFAACYAPGKDDVRVLQDDPQTSVYRTPPVLFSGGGGMVSTASDYFRFCQMVLNGGTLDGERLLSRKTIDLMRINHLPNGDDLAARQPPGQFSEAATSGTGFGLGFSVLIDLAKSQIAGSPGQFAWGGAASTAFWIDPVEQVVLVYMTQLLPSSKYPFRRELQVFVNAAMDD